MSVREDYALFFVDEQEARRRWVGSTESVRSFHLMQALVRSLVVSEGLEEQLAKLNKKVDALYLKDGPEAALEAIGDAIELVQRDVADLVRLSSTPSEPVAEGAPASSESASEEPSAAAPAATKARPNRGKKAGGASEQK